MDASGTFVIRNATLFDAELGVRTGGLAVADGTILPDAHALPAEVPALDAGGRVLLPGFRDAHCHFLFIGLQLVRPDLTIATSRTHALDLIRSALDDPDQPEALLAEGWDEFDWDGSDPLTGRDLDALGSDRPIVARRTCTHTAAANQAALRFFPESELVDRGRGLLFEGPAMAVGRIMPGREGERARALDAAVRAAHRCGVVSVHELLRTEDMEVLSGAAREGRLPLDVRFFLRHEEWADMEPGRLEDASDERGRFRVVGVKFFTDGSFGARTAAISRPYVDGGRGLLLWEPDAITAAIRRVHEAGLRSATHAIGDRGLRLVLDALEATGVAGDRIEHVESADDDDVRRMAALGVTASMQPNFVRRWAHPGGLYDAALGPERARRTNRFGSLSRAGVPLAFGSDSMPFGPLFGLAGAVAHPTPEERVTLAEALEAYTAGGPRSVGEDAGTLRPGQPAHLCLLSARALDASAFQDADVDVTWFAGDLVHAREV